MKYLLKPLGVLTVIICFIVAHIIVFIWNLRPYKTTYQEFYNEMDGIREAMVSESGGPF